ncbi:MAG: hypothetical protein RR543_04270 [Erysipelotrichales bacterium]
MLGKLIKYDLKAMAKPMAVFFLITLITVISSLILRKFTNITWVIDLFFGLISFAAGLLIFISFIMAIVIVVRRFVTNVLKDEGYLTNTLPVSKATILASKSICATIVVTVSGLISIILIILLSGGFKDFIWGLQEIFRTENVPVLTIILFGILIISQAFVSVCALNFSFALGHSHSKNKTLMSVLYIFLTYIAAQVILVILTVVLSKLIDSNLLFSSIDTLDNVNVIIIGITFIVLCGSAILFALTNFVLNNKLNLE